MYPGTLSYGEHGDCQAGCPQPRTSMSSNMRAGVTVRNHNGPVLLHFSSDILIQIVGCTFDNNTPEDAPTLLDDARSLSIHPWGLFYSDDLELPVCIWQNTTKDTVPECEMDTALALETAPGVNYGSATDPWFVQVQQDHEFYASGVDSESPMMATPAVGPPGALTSMAPTSVLPSAATPPTAQGATAVPEAALGGEDVVQRGAAQQAPATDSTESNARLMLPIVLGSVAAVVVLLGLAAVALFLLKRRRGGRRIGRDEKGKAASALAGGTHKSEKSDTGAAGVSLARGTTTGAAGTDMSVDRDTNKTVATGTTRSNTTRGLSQLSDGSRAALKGRHKARIEEQLDGLAGRKLLRDLVVLPGFQHRAAGGQAVVQIVADDETRAEFAVKFFLSEAAFAQEKALYHDASRPMGRFLPQLHSMHEYGQLRDARGNALPACIVMERGVALDVWVAEAGGRLDTVGCLQVLSHVAERVLDLHAAGYVHRDLKPCNIMWLPRQKRFTLIDFGLTEATSTSAAIAFTLRYAAPEVLEAVVQGSDTMEVQEAVDAWAVGMVALELFSGKLVFDVMQTQEQVINMILGDEPAPWECADSAPGLLQRVGRLRGVVGGLLHRDPRQRTTIAQVASACKRVLADTSVPEAPVEEGGWGLFVSNPEFHDCEPSP